MLTQIQLERILSPNGPTFGHLKRPSDRKRPSNILFINCVGSRNLKTNAYCSVVCCNLSVKNSKLIIILGELQGWKSLILSKNDIEITNEIVEHDKKGHVKWAFYYASDGNMAFTYFNMFNFLLH